MHFFCLQFIILSSMFLTFCSSQFHLPAHIAHNMPKYHILNYLIILVLSYKLVFPLQYVSVMYFDVLNSMDFLQFPSSKLAIAVQSCGKFAILIFCGSAFCSGWKQSKEVHTVLLCHKLIGLVK